MMWHIKSHEYIGSVKREDSISGAILISKRPDYEQESLIQDLWMKDILCTRTD
jgi:hypothetical protein